MFSLKVCEGKITLLPEELEAIQAGLIIPEDFHPGQRLLVPDDYVPEELFRRYTDTDSRPVTPTPTLASIVTKSSTRRCVTPDPNLYRERKLLVVDLRRSHSIETLSWKVSVRNSTPVSPSPPERVDFSPLTVSRKTPKQLKVEQLKLVPHPALNTVTTPRPKSVRFKKSPAKKKSNESEEESVLQKKEDSQEVCRLITLQ